MTRQTVIMQMHRCSVCIILYQCDAIAYGLVGDVYCDEHGLMQRRAHCRECAVCIHW